MIREQSGAGLGAYVDWWFERIKSGIDHGGVIAQLGEESGWSAHFAVMTLLSAGIAVLGLLLSSPAVVIGAMLISPLMGPIIALGFGLAMFDSREIRRNALALASGVALAILFCALIVVFSPLQTVTSEIAARTRPNLFDLLVALFSGLAGTYAMIRGRHGAIVGVAIATALMPPLAVMGFGLATTNWPVLGGSALLFFTNLMTIAASAAVLARVYGFAPHLSPQQTRLQATLILLALMALAVPLALSLRQIATEALANRQAGDAIAASFPPSARVSDLVIDYHSHPVAVTATVLTPRYNAQAERNLTAVVARVVGRPIELSLDQILTADGSDEGQAVAGGASASQRNASRVAERLAMVAGVSTENVLVDRVAKRVTVHAAPLPGASLQSYRALEARVSAAESGWAINLIPPAMALPAVVMEDGHLAPDTLDTAVWAADRLQLPIAVVGGPTKEAEGVAAQLQDAGVSVVRRSKDGRADRVELRWEVAESPPGQA